MSIVNHDVRNFGPISNNPQAFKVILQYVSTPHEDFAMFKVTFLISCQCIGDRKNPCLSMRNLRKGNATGFEKNTLPIFAGILAKAYLTHRIIRSSNHVACRVNGEREFLLRRRFSYMKLSGSLMTIGSQ